MARDGHPEKENKMIEWREVTKDEFYAGIGSKNVHPRIVTNNWPYTSVFLDRFGGEHGKIIGYIPEGKADEVKRYMLPSAGLVA